MIILRFIFNTPLTIYCVTTFGKVTKYMLSRLAGEVSRLREVPQHIFSCLVVILKYVFSHLDKVS